MTFCKCYVWQFKKRRYHLKQKGYYAQEKHLLKNKLRNLTLQIKIFCKTLKVKFKQHLKLPKQKIIFRKKFKIQLPKRLWRFAWEQQFFELHIQDFNGHLDPMKHRRVPYTNVPTPTCLGFDHTNQRVPETPNCIIYFPKQLSESKQNFKLIQINGSSLNYFKKEIQQLQIKKSILIDKVNKNMKWTI